MRKLAIDEQLFALAEHGDYHRATVTLGVKENTFSKRISDARAAFLVLWRDREAPSKPWGHDKRTGRRAERLPWPGQDRRHGEPSGPVRERPGDCLRRDLEIKDGRIQEGRTARREAERCARAVMWLGRSSSPPTAIRREARPTVTG
jgi:hypothetical protein